MHIRQSIFLVYTYIYDFFLTIYPNINHIYNIIHYKNYIILVSPLSNSPYLNTIQNQQYFIPAAYHLPKCPACIMVFFQ